MNETMISDRPVQLYSQKAIGIATFLGGPLAAGILVRKNYRNLGNDLYANHSLSIGIFATILLFGGLFLIPEHVIDKIPNSIIPAIYTAIIYVVVEKLQGKELKAHESVNKPFYSIWNAVGVGVVCLLVILAGVFGPLYLYSTTNFDADKYDKGLAEIQKHEERALALFDFDESTNSKEVIEFIQQEGIPAWEKNIDILNQMDAIEGLTPELKNQNQILKEYCELRIKSYRLIEKATSEQTDIYNSEIERLDKEIEEKINRL